MFDKPYKYGMCIFCCIGLFCLGISFVCISLFIIYAGDESYKFLGEVSIYTFLLALLFLIIRGNIKSENNGKLTKVTPNNSL